MANRIGLIQEQIYMQIFLNCHWPRFRVLRGNTYKKQPNDNLKRFACTVYLFLYHPLYDLTNPISRSLISVLALINALGRNLISVLGFTNPLGCKLISALVLTSHLKCHTIFYFVWPCLFLTAPGCFCLAYPLFL